MNDRPTATEAAAFDPARAGWKIVKPIGFGELVGPIWRNGDARFGFLVEGKHLNFADIVHGGMLATLADQAMGMTALRASGNKPHATIELNMQFIDAVRLNEFVEAHCEVVRLTRAIIFMQCKRRHALGGERDGDLEDTRRSVSGPHLDPPPLRGRKAITSSRSLQGGSG